MTDLPPVLGLLQPGRRDALRRDFEALRAEGRNAEQALSVLAMQKGIAPSFLRQLLEIAPGSASEET